MRHLGTRGHILARHLPILVPAKNNFSEKPLCRRLVISRMIMLVYSVILLTCMGKKRVEKRISQHLLFLYISTCKAKREQQTATRTYSGAGLSPEIQVLRQARTSAEQGSRQKYRFHFRLHFSLSDPLSSSAF